MIQNRRNSSILIRVGIKYQNHICSFQKIIEKDYGKKRFGFTKQVLQMVCLDMDAIEAEEATGGIVEQSMDTVAEIIVTNQRSNNHQNSVLPIELKLGQKNAQNFDVCDLKRKDRNTRDFIQHNSNGLITIEKNSIFVYGENVAPVVRYLYYRKQKESNAKDISHWKIMSPKEVNEYIATL